MSSIKTYVVRAFGWGLSARLLDASVKFISLPILLSFFGKENFGLITLAVSVNAYLQLLDMGMNTGAIKYFSEWIGNKKYATLDSVARTSITFYGVIGLVNSLVLILLGFFGASIFSIPTHQVIVFEHLLFVLAAAAVINWSSSVFSQLLIANESIHYTQQVNIVKSIIYVVLIVCTVAFSLDVVHYFVGYTVINSLSVIPFYLKARKEKLITGFIPAFDFKQFNVIFRYSLAIVSMAVFQMSAAKLRPLILNIYSGASIEILTDFRIMETITFFIISIGGMFSSIFLPKASKLLQEKNSEAVANFAYSGTLFTSIICIFLCIPFILCSKEIITLYVGLDYVFLSSWTSIWVLTILGYLHSTPVNSILLATGKTKILVWTTAISCVVSLIINALLAPSIGVGAAVLGYSVYIMMQMTFYYAYFINKILKIDSMKVLKAFFVPTAIAIISMAAVLVLDIRLSSVLLQLILKCTLWCVLFTVNLIVFKIIDIKILTASFFKVVHLKRS